MEIITAFADSQKNLEIKKYINSKDIVREDIYYIEGILDMLNVYPNTKLIIISEDIIGSEKIYETIQKVKRKYFGLKILLLSDNQRLIRSLRFLNDIVIIKEFEELKYYLESNDIYNILEFENYTKNNEKKNKVEKENNNKGGILTDKNNFNIENIEDLKDRLNIFKQTGIVIDKNAVNTNDNGNNSKLKNNRQSNKKSKDKKDNKKIRTKKIKNLLKSTYNVIISSIKRIIINIKKLKNQIYLLVRMSAFNIIYIICKYEVYKEQIKELIRKDGVKIKKVSGNKYNKDNEDNKKNMV